MNSPGTCPKCGAPLPARSASSFCPACLYREIGQPLPSEDVVSDAATQPQSGLTFRVEPSETLGAMIGRYKLLEKLGEGGFGTVWAAEQRDPVKRRVALKIIKLGMDTKQVVARFEAERQALALMDHPNIAKVLDGGATENGRPYFVMELVRGIPITAYCDERKLNTAARLDLFVKVCQAIQHAHQKGIIHRDIKPSNILVTLHDGVPVPKVIDFGIAKATQQELTEKTIYTRHHQFIGTPAYMSPEQAELSGLDIDTRSDIYSLGVLLYELLTGLTPFDGKELMASGIDAMRRTIREQEPPRPSTKLARLEMAESTTTAARRGSDVPRLVQLLRGDLDWIVMKCLEKDRARRYETANGLATDIQRYLKQEPVVARPPSAIYRFHRAFQRNTLAFASAAVVGVVLIVGALVSTWQALEASRARNAAQGERDKARTAQAEAERAQQAEKQERLRADAEKLVTRHNLYVADMNLAHRALKEGNVRRAESLLEAHVPKSGEIELCGFEWHTLKRLCRGDQSYSFPAQPYVVSGVAFSPDGKLLATGSGDWEAVPDHASRRTSRGELRLFDLMTKREIVSLPHPSACVISLAFSRDSQTLVAGNSDGSITLLTIADQKLGGWPTGHTNAVVALSFSPDGQMLASGSAPDGMLTLWKMTPARETRTVNVGHGIWTLAFAPDGRRIAVAGDGLVITLVDVATTNRVTIPWRGTWINSLAFSPDGKFLAIANNNTFVQLVDAASLGTGAPIVTTLGQHQSRSTSVAFSPDGRTLLSASEDHTLKLWDISRQKELGVLKGHHDAVRQVAISPDGETIASASADKTLKLWSLSPVQDVDVVRFSDSVNSIDFSGDGKWLATGSDDGAIGLLHRATRGQHVTFRGHTGGVFAVLFSKDSKLLISAGGDRTIKIWDADSQRGEPVAILSGHQGSVFRLGLSPDGRTLVSASGNWGESDPGVVKFWDFSRKEVTASFEAHPKGIGSMAISPDGRFLATGSWDETVKVWDFASRKLLAHFQEHSGIVFALAFSPDGKTLASGCTGSKLILWDVATWQKLHTFDGIATAVGGLVFTRDGKTLVEASANGSVRLWNVTTRKELLTPYGHGGFLGIPVFSPDGRVLATPSADQTVRLWPAARFLQDESEDTSKAR